MPNTVERQAELLGHYPYLGIPLKRGLYDLIDQLPVKITRPDQFYCNRRANARAINISGGPKFNLEPRKTPPHQKLRFVLRYTVITEIEFVEVLPYVRT